MAETFAFPRAALDELMGAPAVVYVVEPREGSRALAIRDHLEEAGEPYLVVGVVGLPPAPDDRAVRCLVRVPAGAPVAAFEPLDDHDDLVVVPAAPTADPSVVVVDLGADTGTRAELEVLPALVRWIERAGRRAWILATAGADDVGPLAAALRDRRETVAARDHATLLEEHREQAMLLSDLRLEYDELLQQAVALEKERDTLKERASELRHAEAGTREERDRLREELDALHATRTFRYTNGIRRAYTRAYTSVRAAVFRRPG